ncbi:MAG: hypothetical protein LBS12_00285 [Prevotellaceae bacterium]|jgi:hypothetical protein|nr:hypothetical protein [Prevotellaceae bacterium]
MPPFQESGINTYVSHFRLLIDVSAGFGAAYAPSRTDLTITALETKLTAVRASIDAVAAKLPAYLIAESVRIEEFYKLKPLAVRIRATAINCNLPVAVVNQIKEIVRKIQGRRARPIIPLEGEGDVATTHYISVAQTSYDSQITHFRDLVAIVAGQTGYTPSATDIKVPALQAQLERFIEFNDDVLAASVPLKDARQKRNELLYEPGTGMIDTALAVKGYVKGTFGSRSAQYREVSHIPFRNKKINLLTD